MAIDTVNKKLSLLSLGVWTVPAMPISADGIGTDDKWHLLHDYAGKSGGVIPPVTGALEWILRYRRRGKR